MPKIRARAKSKDEQCAVCKDGPSGLLLCRGCSTLIHAACLVDVRGCPTIGCDEADPLQPEPEPVNTTRMEAGPRLYEEPRAKNSAFLDLVSLMQDRLDGKERVDPRPHAQEARAEKREFNAKIAQAKATRMIPHCLHDFSPENNKCIHCKVDMFAFASKEFGSAWTGPRKHEVKVRRVDADALKRLEKHWADKTSEFVIEYVGRFLSLIFLAVCISIWLFFEFGSAFL